MDLQKTIDKYNLHTINIEGDLIISKNELEAIINEARSEQLLIHGVVKSLCDHHWVDAKNIAVKSGQMCVKCHNVKA